jgi:hypothetical protein
LLFLPKPLHNVQHGDLLKWQIELESRQEPVTTNSDYRSGRAQRCSGHGHYHECHREGQRIALPGAEGQADVAPLLRENPVFRPGDLWLATGAINTACSGDATSADAGARLLGDRKPFLMIAPPANRTGIFRTRSG